MRQLLGVLRAGDTGGSGRAPGLGDLRELVGRVHGQGLVVTLRAAELGEVPGTVSLAAYRVVQEALTNVVKHSDASRATVEVCASGGAVLVTVEDYAGLAAPQAEAGPPSLPGEAAQPPGERAGGTGLAGMRERVACFGGEMSAGPAGDHPGWRVRARIPYDAEDAG
jgi:signal transduction histidine kinase